MFLCFLFANNNNMETIDSSVLITTTPVNKTPEPHDLLKTRVNIPCVNERNSLYVILNNKHYFRVLVNAIEIGKIYGAECERDHLTQQLLTKHYHCLVKFEHGQEVIEGNQKYIEIVQCANANTENTSTVNNVSIATITKYEYQLFRYEQTQKGWSWYKKDTLEKTLVGTLTVIREDITSDHVLDCFVLLSRENEHIKSQLNNLTNDNKILLQRLESLYVLLQDQLHLPRQTNNHANITNVAIKPPPPAPPLPSCNIHMLVIPGYKKSVQKENKTCSSSSTVESLQIRNAKQRHSVSYGDMLKEMTRKWSARAKRTE
jgi:hypothetical protein